MRELIDLIDAYRRASSVTSRLDYAGSIYAAIRGDLRLFAFGRIHPSAADDVLQETLKAILTNLGKFQGKTEQEFWAWCYRIARNKINDEHRKRSADRLEPFPMDELQKLVDKATEYQRPSIIDEMDVKHALDLLQESKPECREFLWNHFVLGLDYAEIADELQLKYDAVRMKIGRCLETARMLLTT